MSYYTVKNGISGILNALGFTESTEAEDFTDASSGEMGNTFIIKSASGELIEENETLSDRFYDKQKWEIKFAFVKSSQNDIINRDEMHEEKDSILRELDDPTNWRSFVRHMKYLTWEVSDLKSYFILTVTLAVTDTYTY